jgi:hypothetical protein
VPGGSNSEMQHAAPLLFMLAECAAQHQQNIPPPMPARRELAILECATREYAKLTPSHQAGALGGLGGLGGLGVSDDASDASHEDCNDWMEVDTSQSRAIENAVLQRIIPMHTWERLSNAQLLLFHDQTLKRCMQQGLHMLLSNVMCGIGCASPQLPSDMTPMSRASRVFERRLRGVTVDGLEWPVAVQSSAARHKAWVRQQLDRTVQTTCVMWDIVQDDRFLRALESETCLLTGSMVDVLFAQCTTDGQLRDVMAGSGTPASALRHGHFIVINQHPQRCRRRIVGLFTLLASCNRLLCADAPGEFGDGCPILAGGGATESSHFSESVVRNELARRPLSLHIALAVDRANSVNRVIDRVLAREAVRTALSCGSRCDGPLTMGVRRACVMNAVHKCMRVMTQSAHCDSRTALRDAVQLGVGQLPNDAPAGSRWTNLQGTCRMVDNLGDMHTLYFTPRSEQRTSDDVTPITGHTHAMVLPTGACVVTCMDSGGAESRSVCNGVRLLRRRM